MFAGSIFDLEPDTEYECRFVLTDPDGVEGKQENIVTVRTRFEPTPAAGGKPITFTRPITKARNCSLRLPD